MNFFQVVYEEFRAIFSNFAVLFVIIIGSLLYAFLYPAPYKNDIVDSQKIAIVDLDNTSLSKKLIFLVQSTPQVDVDYILSSTKKAKKLLESGEVYGILQIPEGFQADVKKNIPTTLVYSANASYFLIYGAIIDGVYSAVQELSGQIKHNKMLLQNNIQDSELIVKNPIALFNSSGGYINYALSAIFVFILHQTLIAGVAILGASQNQKNLKGIIGYWNKAGALKLVLARMSAFFVIYIILFLLYFGFLFQLYGISINADIISFWCFAIMFILCCGSFGVLLGLLLKHPSLPMQIILVSSLPFVFMMGFIWPIELLPSFVITIDKFIPAFHGINGFVRLNQMGAGLSLVMNHFYWLLGLCIFCIILCVLMINKKRSGGFEWKKREINY